MEYWAARKTKQKQGGFDTLTCCNLQEMRYRRVCKHLPFLSKVGESIGIHLLVYAQKSLRKDKQETDNTNCPKGGGWVPGGQSPIRETFCTS